MSGKLDVRERDAQSEALAALYAETTNVRHPFAPLPTQPLRTRNELRQHFASAARISDDVERFEAEHLVVHQTGDPEVVVVEFTYAVNLQQRHAGVPQIYVVRVRDGEIVESRDYADHLGMARAFGRLPALLEQLAPPSPGPGELGRSMHNAFNTLNLDAVDQLFAPDFYSHPLRTRGPAAVKQRWQAMRVATPELRTEVVDVVAQGERVAIRSRLNDGSGELIELLRIADGRIAELWGARVPSAEHSRSESR